MRTSPTNPDPAMLALMALAWSLEDARRAERLLALTGLTTEDLRARAAEPSLQAAVLGFLESFEPDLIACADSLGASPQQLIAARVDLER